MEADLKEKLNEDLKNAMKSGDTVRRSVLRLMLSAVKNAEIAKRDTLENSDILGIISKEAKQREESIEAFKQGNRPDLIAIEEAELVIINEYLPEQITRDEIVAEARRIIQEVGAEGPRDKGKVMPKLVAELKGKADGREINEVVTELLG
ncbi:GatB/YqeY domain-containing protein [Chloroflexota bacterium]